MSCGVFYSRCLPGFVLLCLVEFDRCGWWEGGGCGWACWWSLGKYTDTWWGRVTSGRVHTPRETHWQITLHRMLIEALSCQTTDCLGSHLEVWMMCLIWLVLRFETPKNIATILHHPLIPPSSITLQFLPPPSPSHSSLLHHPLIPPSSTTLSFLPPPSPSNSSLLHHPLIPPTSTTLQFLHHPLIPPSSTTLSFLPPPPPSHSSHLHHPPIPPSSITLSFLPPPPSHSSLLHHPLIPPSSTTLSFLPPPPPSHSSLLHHPPILPPPTIHL